MFLKSTNKVQITCNCEHNKTGNVRSTWQWGAFTKLPLLWKSNKYYKFVCVWARVTSMNVLVREGVGLCLLSCSLTYPACKAHAPYCHLRPLWLHHIFPHFLINGTNFRKKLLNIKFVFWFYLQHLLETFLILRSQWDIVTNVKMSSCEVPVILSDFRETRILSTDFRKKYRIKSYQNTSSGSWIIPCRRTEGRTDGHNEANSRFSKFCECA
jgi:hypothetical protein